MFSFYMLFLFVQFSAPKRKRGNPKEKMNAKELTVQVSWKRQLVNTTNRRRSRRWCFFLFLALTLFQIYQNVAAKITVLSHPSAGFCSPSTCNSIALNHTHLQSLSHWHLHPPFTAYYFYSSLLSFFPPHLLPPSSSSACIFALFLM